MTTALSSSLVPIKASGESRAIKTTSTIPKPSEFMRGRRPTLFSDSLAARTLPLSREAFSHHIETLTARSEESQFQRFVHALLEVEVCPNLLPQTGPTGGGDAKVDTETYPVSDAVATRWWRGVAREAAQEDWAFAISAMKDWKKKARSDIDNVLASGRKYSLIYFVTSQYARAKDRDKLEKELKRRAKGIPVRILDRSWIMQSVYDHERWNIAERELGLSGIRPNSPGTIGPNDAERAQQLDHVDREIQDPKRFVNSSMQLAHAWLTTALLARGLGRSRQEVDERFDRAIDAARSSGSARGLRRMLYQKAWTDFWWFDDVPAVLSGYDVIESLLDDDTNSWDLDQVTNLYVLLHTAEMHGWLPAGSAHLDERRQRLLARLQPLAVRRRSHPTDSAWARTHILHLELFVDPQNPEVHARLVKGLGELLREVDKLRAVAQLHVRRCFT